MRPTGKKGVGRMIGTIALCAVAVVLAAVFALLLVGGLFSPQAYLDPWSKSYAQKYKDIRVRLTAQGMLAANGHNMQPWKVKLDPGDPMVFDLYADASRLTPEVDPPARQMMITQGTFLEYVRVAAAQEGYAADIALFPQGEYDEADLKAQMSAKPVARITLKPDAAEKSGLYDGIFVPDTNRTDYLSARLTDAQKQALLRAADGADMAAAGVQAQVVDDAQQMQKLGDYALRAATVEADTARVIAEQNDIFRNNERQKNRFRYGFSVEGQGTSGLSVYLLQGLLTLFPSLNAGASATQNMINATKEQVAHTPAYVLLTTSGNSRTAQVQSGMAYSALVLLAYTQGLALQPLSQALEEYPEMHTLYEGIHRDFAPQGGTIQMLVRVGRPSKQVPRSMRRDVSALLLS